VRLSPQFGRPLFGENVERISFNGFSLYAFAT
jgi:hypothetical protein